MEKLLDDDDNLQQFNQRNKYAVKRNCLNENALLLQSFKLHKLPKQLLKLKITKSNNRTTAQFFSKTFYRRLKIPKRRRQFNPIRVAILCLLLVLVYLYWSHRTFFKLNESNAKEYLKSYRATNSLEETSDTLDSNPKQIDHNLKKDEKIFNNRKTDQKHNLIDDLEEKNLEFQHLFSSKLFDGSTSSMSSTISKSSKINDRSSFYWNSLISNEKDSKNITTNNVKFNKEIKKIQNNDQHKTVSFVTLSSTADIDSSKLERTNRISSNNAARQRQQLPAHIIVSRPILSLKNITFLDKANDNLVSKSNQSYSIVTVEQKKETSNKNRLGRKTNNKSILEKQMAWYELVGITMFNLLGASLEGQSSNKKSFENLEKYQNFSKNQTRLNSTSKTFLTKPTSYSSDSSVQFKQHEHLKNNYHHLNKKKQNISERNSENDKLEQRLPQCIIIGVRKAGTRAVLEYLSLNDHIRKADNELHFFDNDEHYSLGLDYYKNQMPKSYSWQYTIEKSPAYFVTSNVPERIKAMNSSIKLILIVRDPVTRLISDYTQLASNKLLKLENFMRTSGSLNKQQSKQKQQYKKMENHFLQFPIDKEEQRTHSEREEQDRATNEQFVDRKIENSNLDVDRKDKRVKLIEKGTSGVDNIVKRKQPPLVPFNADYWNRLGSELDYRKVDQFDAEKSENLNNEDDVNFKANSKANSVHIKRQQRSILMNKNGNWSMMFKNLKLEMKKQNKTIDFKPTKIIDFESTNKNSKLKNEKDFRTQSETRFYGWRGSLKTKKSITRKDEKIDRNKQIKDALFDSSDKRTNRIGTNKRIRRQIDLNQNSIENNVEQQEQTDDEDEIYRTYRDELNPDNTDDEDVELDDYLNFKEKNDDRNIKKQPSEVNRKNKQLTLSAAQSIQIKKHPIEQVRSVQDDHWRIPRFEDLVITSNDEVNTNYKPVKTSIYSLYMNAWLKVFNRDQIHIVDGDRLIKEPHVELNKIENFLGLPNQIQASHFVFNKRKNFFCARMPNEHHRQHLSAVQNDRSSISSNSSTSWRRMTKDLNNNKFNGRHSSIRCLNSSKGRRHPKVDKQVMTKLRQFYAPFNAHFERMVGKVFNWSEL